MATSRRVGNYATSAKAVTQASDQIFDAAMSSKPDFTKISKEAIKGRSLERRAVTEAEGRVAQAGLEAFTKAKRTKNDVESAERINDIKRPAKRMAGAVAGLGAIAGGYVMMEGNKRDKAERAELKAERDALNARQEARWAASDQRYENIMKGFNNSSDSSNSTVTPKTPKPSGAGSTVPSSTAQPTSDGKGGTGMKYMRTLVNSGMSPTQAAALVGHLEVESDNFQAHEEYAPNAYGTKGAGVLQWTNIPGGSQRRTEFQNWSSNQGLDPKSFEANSGYLLHEMSKGNHWTGGGNLSEFKGITDLTQASQYLESNYIRPSAGSSGRRQSAGQNYLTQWNNLNSN